jgi:RNA polymerase sigma-70 factor (ECF subfamily)
MAEPSWLEQVQESYARVYRALVAAGASGPDAADALQDAVETALRQTSRIERPAAWLFVVALRRWKAQRWRARLLAPLEWLRQEGAVSPPGENAVLLLSELRRLPSREREVIVARYIVGLSQREAAEALGIAVGTVAATTVHATRKLRERLGGRDERSRSDAPAVR